MYYLLLAGLVVLGLIYAAYKAPFASKVPAPVRWLLGAGLLIFVYLLGVWTEVLWARSTDDTTTLLSMAWEQRLIGLAGAIFIAVAAFIRTSNQGLANRWLIVAAAAICGAITGIGIGSLFDLLNA